MKLVNIINDIIKDKGYISVSNFINLALYHPTFGYYQKKNPFGMGGDFITAPQISSLFNEMISLFFIYQFKKNFHNQEKIYFIEYGAGNGFFIKDFLTVVKKIPELYSRLEVILVEISDNLQKEQAEKLKDFSDVKISWKHDALSALATIEDDANKNLIFIFSNEFFDAFPINQYIKHEDKWHEICVIKKEVEEGYDFGFTHFDYTSAIKKHLEIMDIEEESLKSGEIVEVSNDVIEIYTESLRKIKRNNGCIMTIDYGFAKTAFHSTLQSLKNHQKNEILTNIGEADITYLVNFELLFYISQNEGLTVLPPITQKMFLESIGILEKQKILIAKEQDEAKRYALERSTERLISELQMGELFKVLICEHYK